MLYKVNKNLLYKSAKDKIISTHPELLHKLKSQKFKDALIFLDGFLACLNVMAEDPIRKQDIDELVVQELVKFILDEKRES